MKRVWLITFLILIAIKCQAVYINGPSTGFLIETKDQQIKDRVISVLNSRLDTLQRGRIVYVNGSIHNDYTVDLCSPNYYPYQAFGITDELIYQKQPGNIRISGVFKGYNTTDFEENDELYLSQNGTFTKVEPLTGPKISIGTVIKVDEFDGWILINIINKR